MLMRISRISYKGYNPSYQYEKPPPTVVGWSTPDDLQYGLLTAASMR